VRSIVCEIATFLFRASTIGGTFKDWPGTVKAAADNKVLAILPQAPRVLDRARGVSQTNA
jgi:hypothetical protein